MYVEIRGVQFVNKGAELMLYAVLQQLEQHLPDAAVVLEPGVNSPFRKRMEIGALQKFSIRKGKLELNNLSYLIPSKLRRWLISNFGIITEADIDVVLDASGFAYGDQWSSFKIKHLCREILRRVKHDKKFILLPQALGPFTRQADKKSLQKALPSATLVCAREETSYQHVEQVAGKFSGLVKYGDFTNLVSPIVERTWQNATGLMLVIPNYNMLSPRNTDKRWLDSYVALMVQAVVLAKQQGMVPTVLNHEGVEDDKVCQAIKQACGQDINIVHEPDPRKVKGIISVASLVICSRFHGCVSALSQGVPCLGTSWSHKYERLFEEYNLSECLLEPYLSKEALQEKITFAIESTKPRSEQKRLEFKAESERMWADVFDAIK